MNAVDLIAACLQLEDALRLGGFSEEADQIAAVAQSIADKASPNDALLSGDALSMPSGGGVSGSFSGLSPYASGFSGSSGRPPFASGSSRDVPLASGQGPTPSLGLTREDLSFPPDYEPKGPWTRGLQRAFARQERAESEQASFSGIFPGASGIPVPSGHGGGSPYASGAPVVSGSGDPSGYTLPPREGFEPFVSGEPSSGAPRPSGNRRPPPFRRR